jgi:hypothetical protein
MAAGTTVLGMLPLFSDPFFVGMAVTIIGGLSFATLLTLIVVPVLHATFYRIPARATARTPGDRPGGIRPHEMPPMTPFIKLTIATLLAGMLPWGC